MKLVYKFFTLFFMVSAFFYTGVMAMGADVETSIQESIAYAIEVSHRENCVLTDGYGCLDIKEDDFIKETNDRVLVPGNYLIAWQICYDDFKNIEDMSEEQKRLKHYRIGFTEDSENYILLFSGLMLPKMVDGKPEGIILGIVGRTTKYWVDKKTLSINKRLFQK